jgi:hypothetical protein
LTYFYNLVNNYPIFWGYRFGFIVFIVICLWFGSNKKEAFRSKENRGVKVVVYENSSMPTRTTNLEKLLAKFGYDYDILGKGDKWSGWYGRMQTYQKYLKDVDDDAYLLFSDGRDVLVDEDAKVFADKASIPIAVLLSPVVAVAA